MTRDHHHEITAQQAKYREVCRDADTRIAELNDSNTKQCEEFRRQILQTNLEADRLRNQLAKLEMKQDTTGDKSQEIVDRTMREMDKQSFRQPPVYTPEIHPALAKKQKAWNDVRSAAIFALFGVLLYAIISAVTQSFYIRSAICSPSIPGTTITSSTPHTIFEAPWWAPRPLKHKAFSLFCSSAQQPQTKLEFKSGNLILWDVQNNKRLIYKKNIKLAIVHAQSLNLTNKREHKEVVDAPWQIRP